MSRETLARAVGLAGLRRGAKRHCIDLVTLVAMEEGRRELVSEGGGLASTQERLAVVRRGTPP